MFANLCGIDIFWILSWSYCLKKKKLELSCTGIVVLLHTAFEPSHFGTEEQRLSSYYICWSCFKACSHLFGYATDCKNHCSHRSFISCSMSFQCTQWAFQGFNTEIPISLSFVSPIWRTWWRILSDWLPLDDNSLIIYWLFNWPACYLILSYTGALLLFSVQAMFEGILVDIPFATFFLSKLKKK